jgi:hypothetical protein
MQTPKGVEEAALAGTHGKTPIVSVAGEPMNPYSFGTPNYWVWHGANEARKVLTSGTL